MFKYNIVKFYLYSLLVLSSYYSHASLGTPAYTSASVNGTSISLSWGAVPNANYYRLRFQDGGGSWVVSGGIYYGNSKTWHNVTGTINRRSYSMRACNNSGCGGWSSASGSITYPDATLSPPSYTLASTSGNSVSVSWGTVSGATYYKLRFSDNGGSSWFETASSYSSTSKTWQNINSAILNRSYSTKACNQVSCSSWSNASNVISYVPRPSSASASVSGNSITLAWSTVANATSYQLRYSDNNGATWHSSATSLSGSSVTWSNLNESIVNRIYAIKACIAQACSDWSPSSSAVTFIPAPTSATASTSVSSVSLSWAEVSHASYYKVRFSDNGGINWHEVGHLYYGGTTTWSDIQEAIVNRSYSVKACTNTHCSDWSSWSNQISYIPPASISLTLTPGNHTTNYSLNWTTSNSLDNYEYILEQNINNQRLPNQSSLWIAVAQVQESGSYSFSKQLDGLYRYRVRGCDTAGNCDLISNATENHTVDSNYTCPSTEYNP
ncbi:hypothetical protein N473_20540 [Pseudoalteromonas luteoviolacea CPMOR-1]|uniref:Fibronectin type-III domain-containing protein n=1 Tax=Pseudoalteromonas luteoviolacea CPMOR-1 TaxID=1365248 RepID=A0A161YKM4_9GAMM|nr:hypothetical protein [Pseudoalteromonas luteoviolacea]KZN61933.1 hypothetical protein N473_20540 [Pseudoalteromonas luteoviolacea CPMOR-1]